MRKRIKKITEVVHDYGTIALENSLLQKLLEYANSEDVTMEHVDMMIDKAINISEEEKGEPLTVCDHIVPITTGTPAALAAMAAAETAKALYK